MQNLKTILVAMFLGMFITSGWSQGPHHGNRHHDLWPGNLETITVSGTVIVDSNFVHPVYYLDENDDGEADFFLSFGPWWYQPQSGATRPGAGETVTIVGALQEHVTPPILIVFEINGLIWREPVAYGMQGWNGDPFWDEQGDTLTVTGTVLVDTTYFYHHYFLDTDNDSIPEYQLGFGPPWYAPESGARRPEAGDQVTIFGRVHETMGIELLVVYEINGLTWRPLDQPAPWAGMWMPRGHADTAFVYCVNDSANWVAFPPGHMGHGMGGMMFPDSVFVQFWEIHPDSLPGPHDEELFMGFYLNVHDPRGNSMMMGQFGGRHGRMRFQREQQVRFHYYDEDLQAAGLSENQLSVRYWDQETQSWRVITDATIDKETNSVTFANLDLSNYYALSAQSVTGIENSPTNLAPGDFIVLQNYPNPFNPSTTIRFEISKNAQVKLEVYNLLGQKIATLVNDFKEAGVYTVKWNGTDASGQSVSSGIYILRVEAGTQVKIRRMTLLK